MPKVISDEDYKKFLELVKEKEEKENQEKLSKELFVQDLIERTKLTLLNLNHKYGPVEAYAVHFAKTMNRFFHAQNIDKHWFNWNDFQEYVTEKCLDRNSKNQIILKLNFRKYLKDYGICCRIERKTGTVKVFRC